MVWVAQPFPKLWGLEPIQRQVVSYLGVEPRREERETVFSRLGQPPTWHRERKVQALE